MKHTIIALFCALMLSLPVAAMAWDGFDAETTGLVAVNTDRMPVVGDAVEIYDYDADNTFQATVLEVRRNVRTIELTVRDPETKKPRMFIMESR